MVFVLVEENKEVLLEINKAVNIIKHLNTIVILIEQDVKVAMPENYYSLIVPDINSSNCFSLFLIDNFPSLWSSTFIIKPTLVLGIYI